MNVLAGIGDDKNVAVLVFGGTKFTPEIPAVYVIVPPFSVGVAVYPDPDLSLHADTFVPEEKVKVAESAESNHSLHPSREVGVNSTALYSCPDSVLTKLVPGFVGKAVGFIMADSTICVGIFVTRDQEL